MSWNIDLDVCALFITMVMLVYYQHRTVLPLMRNKIFLALMLTSLAVVASDIVASVVTAHGNPRNVALVYVLNILYYLFLAFFPFLFMVYCRSLSGYRLLQKEGTVTYMRPLPFVITSAVVVTTPFHHLIFSVDSNGGFSYGTGRPLLYVDTIVYLLIGVLIVNHAREHVRRLHRYAVYLFALCTFFGHTMQVFFLPYKQTVSLCVTIGFLIMFLTYQNPDYARDQKTDMLSEYSLRILKEEEKLYEKFYPTAMIGFENYKVLTSTYTNHMMAEVVKEISLYLRLLFPRKKMFYMHKGRFLILIENKEALGKYRRIIMERCRRPFTVGNTQVWLSPRFVYEDDYAIVKNHTYFTYYNCMRDGLEEAMKLEYGGYVRMSKDIIDTAVRDEQVEDALKKALDQDTLQVYYQPIFCTRGEKTCSAEALVRINDPEIGLLFPDDFIWRAEKNGSILSLGESVLRKVCAFIRDHDMEELGLKYIEVNLSPLQCMRDQLAEDVQSILDEYGVDPKYINLEITESASSDVEVIRANMDALHQNGITFSLDDYGTGYSNLVTVLSLPFKIVKIDKSLVWAYFRDGKDILLKVLHTFEDQPVELVCEGVETEEMARQLADMGCDYEQGFYYSKPVPEDEFVAYCKKELRHT